MANVKDKTFIIQREQEVKNRSFFNRFDRPDVQKAMEDSDGASWSETKSGLEQRRVTPPQLKKLETYSSRLPNSRPGGRQISLIILKDKLYFGK